MRIAIIGSRTRQDRQKVEAYVATLDPQTDTVVSGGCRGVDSWAEAAAKARGIAVVVFLPDKSKMVNRGATVEAFYSRNRLIVDNSGLSGCLPTAGGQVCRGHGLYDPVRRRARQAGQDHVDRRALIVGWARE